MIWSRAIPKLISPDFSAFSHDLSLLVCSSSKAVICCTFAMWRCTFKGHVIRQVPILYGFNQRILKKVARHFNCKEIWYAHKSFEMIFCFSWKDSCTIFALRKDGFLDMFLKIHARLNFLDGKSRSRWVTEVLMMKV